jgi:hypothetical protein
LLSFLLLLFISLIYFSFSLPHLPEKTQSSLPPKPQHFIYLFLALTKAKVTVVFSVTIVCILLYQQKPQSLAAAAGHNCSSNQSYLEKKRREKNNKAHPNKQDLFLSAIVLSLNKSPFL